MIEEEFITLLRQLFVTARTYSEEFDDYTEDEIVGAYKKLIRQAKEETLKEYYNTSCYNAAITLGYYNNHE